MEKETQLSELIFEKAKEMYLTLGFKGVTLDDIARDMGVSKKTIYQHYANKNELVELVGANMMEEIFNEIQKINELGFDSIKELFEIRRYLRDTLEGKYRLAAYQLHRFFPEISKKMHLGRFDKMLDSVKSNLEKGVQEGLYRTGLDIEFTRRMYFAGIGGTKDAGIFPEELFNTHKLHILFLEYHLRAICTKKGIALLEGYLKQA